MKVRDHTLKTTEYKGRWTYAAYKDCPCRLCYNAHDFGYVNSQGTKVLLMVCATRHNKGCPDPLPEPTHTTSPRGRVCKKCGLTVRKETDS